MNIFSQFIIWNIEWYIAYREQQFCHKWNDSWIIFMNDAITRENHWGITSRVNNIGIDDRPYIILFRIHSYHILSKRGDGYSIWPFVYPCNLHYINRLEYCDVILTDASWNRSRNWSHTRFFHRQFDFITRQLFDSIHCVSNLHCAKLSHFQFWNSVWDCV